MDAMIEGIPTPRDKPLHTSRINQDGLLDPEIAMALRRAVPSVIGTKGLFPMMELPCELRLEIYHYLLVIPDFINIETLGNSYYTSNPQERSRRPSVAILQTCQNINEEGTPILYSQNRFIVSLSVEPGPSSSLSNSLFLRGLRWSTVSHLSVVSFISGSTVTPGETRIRRLARPRPSFTCTGADILAHFVEADFLYSPCGPDQYMALSISNWVSMEVMRAELSAFQRALEAMLSTEPAVGIFGE